MTDDVRPVTRRIRLRTRIAFVIAASTAVPIVSVAAFAGVAFGDVFAAPVVAVFVVWSCGVVAISGWFGWWLAGVAVNPLATLAVQLLKLDPSGLEFRSGALAVHDSDTQEVALVKRVLARALQRARDERGRRELVLSGLMHDLKTPLLGQRLLLSRLSGRTCDAYDHDIIPELRRSVSDAIDRVDALVALLRVDAQIDRGFHVQVDLRGIVSRACDVLGEIARTRNVRVSSFGDGFAVGDPQMLSRAVENVIANAVRYADSCVVVEVRPGLVRVVDDGQGFGSDFYQMTHPFESDRIGPEGSGGTAGLGLYIARQTLELHGGRLRLEESRRGHTAVLMYFGAGPS